MKIILFGGSGFIGSALLSSPRFKPYKVVVVSRRPQGQKTIPGVTYAGYDPAVLASFFSGDYVVINLAGAGIGNWLWTPARKKVIRSSRVGVSRLITDLVAGAPDKPRVILQGSAVGYYGSRGDEVLTEAASQGDGFLAEITAEWEEVMQKQLSKEVRVVYLRTGLVLSEKGGLLKKLMIPMRLFTGGYFGDGRQWMPWIHLDDEVAAICYLLEHKTAAGIYNLAAPEPVRMKDFFRELGRQLGRPSWLHVPASLVRLIPGGFGEELLLISQRVKPEQLSRLGFHFQHTSLPDTLKTILHHG